MFPHGGTLLPSIYAEAHYIDAVIVSKAGALTRVALLTGLLLTAGQRIGGKAALSLHPPAYARGRCWAISILSSLTTVEFYGAPTATTFTLYRC